MAQAPFVIQPQLTAISLVYKNKSFIAENVLPRVPVASQSFKWSKYTLGDGFTIPDTRVGRKSAPGQIDWTAAEFTDSTVDFGLEDAVPVADIQNANAVEKMWGTKPIDPMMRSTTLLTQLIATDRENRVAQLVFALGTYPAANRTTLSGTSQWSDTVNSNPVSALMNALDVPVVRPNTLVLGQQTWTALRQHPKVTAAAFPSGGNALGGGTILQREALASLLEIDEVLVGPAWYNTAKPGQTPALARLWGKHAALLYLAEGVETVNDVTFGFTAQWGDRIAGTIERDPSVGLRGGTRVRVGESVKEEISANDAAYFFQNATA
jgi:hypothetical protein